MKKIGITRGKKDVENYINWLTGDDGIEVHQLEVGSNTYKDCAGILLSGGTDIDPDLYDGDKDYDLKPEEWEAERDQYEEAVYKYAKINKIPVLAICRGLQLVNVAEGGTLIQDLGEGNAVHKKELNVDKEHVVTIDSRTLLGDVTGAMSGNVNSAHHQAADPESIGRDLMVSAISKDETVEGLEYKDKTNKGFMIAVQWHPERMQNKETSPLSQGIRKAFIAAIRSFSK